MAAERMPHEASIFAAPLALFARCALARPRIAIAIGVALALLCIAYTAMALGFRTSRLDLLNPRSEWNQRWLAYLNEFGREDDAIVVVEGPDQATVVAAVDDLAMELNREEECFSSVFHRVDLARLRAKGLHLVPVAQLQRLESFVAQAEPVLRGEWHQLASENQFTRLTYALERLPANSPELPPTLDQLERLTAGLESALAATASYHSPWPDGREMQDGYAALEDRHLLADDGRIGMVLVKLVAAGNAGQEVDQAASIARLRDVMALIEARHPDVVVGATGMPILEFDEMQTSQRDMTWTSALSMFGVAACFWGALGGWRHAALAMLALGISMCWAFGFVTFAVGHLNLLSVSFASVLIGQGVDFGIHFVTGYLRARRDQADCAVALQTAVNTVGPGIFTGGLTTSVAFGMTLLTDFTGLQELGMIAGGGILICTVGALVLLPPLIRCVDQNRPAVAMPTIVPMGFLTVPMHRVPRLTLAVLLLFTLFCGAGLLHLRYDHNLLNLQSRGLESVELEHTLIDRAERSVWFALSMSPSREDLLARKEKFAGLDAVSHTEEIVSLVPVEDPLKAESLGHIRSTLALLPDAVPQLGAANHLAVAAAVARLAQVLPAMPSQTAQKRRLDDLAVRLASAEPGDLIRRLSTYQQASCVELVERLRALRAIADPAAPTLADLPRPLVDRYVGVSGQFLLKVYAKGDVWDNSSLERFVREVESVDPQITGHPIQTYYASNQMQRSYLHAGIYAFIAMLIAVIIDLRRLRLSLLSVVPMFLGLVQTFGLLGWLGIPLNAANMIVLPLIFGIGIDDGVHLTHDFIHCKGRYRLDNATFVAVLLTSVTTMVGFGSLILAQHQGLRSLGQVLTLGVLCCLISSTVMLPASFVLWSRRRTVADPHVKAESGPAEPAQATLRIDIAPAACPVPGRVGNEKTQPRRVLSRETP